MSAISPRTSSSAARDHAGYFLLSPPLTARQFRSSRVSGFQARSLSDRPSSKLALGARWNHSNVTSLAILPVYMHCTRM